jgi:hypothetical protein
MGSRSEIRWTRVDNISGISLFTDIAQIIYKGVAAVTMKGFVNKINFLLIIGCGAIKRAFNISCEL